MPPIDPPINAATQPRKVANPPSGSQQPVATFDVEEVLVGPVDNAAAAAEVEVSNPFGLSTDCEGEECSSTYNEPDPPTEFVPPRGPSRAKPKLSRWQRFKNWTGRTCRTAGAGLSAAGRFLGGCFSSLMAPVVALPHILIDTGDGYSGGNLSA